jgi:hypothetical protein
LEEEDSDGPKIVPFRRVEEAQVIAEVGGPVDEVGVTLAIYGGELDPEEITRALGVAPTKAPSSRRAHTKAVEWTGPDGCVVLE